MKIVLVNKATGATISTPMGQIAPSANSIRDVSPKAFLAVKAALDGNANLFYSVWSADVREFGAIGNAVADDKVAIQLGYDTLRTLGGGTLIFPPGKYRVTDQVVNGYKFVDETDINITTPDYTAAASFNSGQFALAQAAPIVHTVFDGEAVLWGDFTAAKAVLYNGICPGSGRGRVGYHNVTILGKPGMSSGGTEVFPATTSGSGGSVVVAAPATVVQGFFAAGAALDIRNMGLRELQRGGCLVSCYWSVVDGVATFHTDLAFVAPGSNAVKADNLTMSYAATDGLQATGQGASFLGIATEECTRSIYVPEADGMVVEALYLEESSLTGNSGYQVTFGDGTLDVVETKFECPHLSTLHGKSVLLSSHAQLTIGAGSHLYPDASHGVRLTDGTSSLWVENNVGAEIDTGGDTTNLNFLGGSLRITQGIRCAGARDTTNAGLSGIVFGRAGWACDAATNLVGLHQDNSGTPSLQFETFSGRVVYGHQTGITAHAGGGQGSAVTLDAEVHFLSTVASAGDSVVLPIGVPGMRIVVFNLGANAADIFPASGGAIDALGTDTAFSLAAGASKEFWAQTATQWRSR